SRTQAWHRPATVRVNQDSQPVPPSSPGKPRAARAGCDRLARVAVSTAAVTGIRGADMPTMASPVEAVAKFGATYGLPSLTADAELESQQGSNRSKSAAGPATIA